MGALAACWLAFPLVMLALTLGCGLLGERLAGVTLPGALLPPVGLAVVVVVAGFCTLTDATASLATPAAVVAAVAGYAVAGRRARLRRPNGWAAAAAVGVFLVYATPVLLSGHATFAGYIKLDDTSTWLAITDRAMSHGRSMAGLAPSTYEATLSNYLHTGYPLGSFLPWGVGHALVGEDLAWLFQPYEAFIAAMLALSAYALVRPLVRRRALAGAAAFVGAQSALLYGYSLWGGVKEMMAAFLVALVAALAGWTLSTSQDALRRPVPLAAASAATLISLSLGGGIWVAAGLLATLVVLVLRRRPVRRVARDAVVFAVAAALLAIPALVGAHTFLKGAVGLEAKSAGGTAEALGNLLRPLELRQIAGIWPSGDFRTDPVDAPLTAVLITIALVAATFGIAQAAARRTWGLVLYVATALIGCAVIAHYGSPWVDGKALATASPAVLLAAAAAAAALADRAPPRSGLSFVAVAPLAVLAAGVLWSNALGYHDANLAPRGQLRDLERIGERFAGQGPGLITDYQPYGARHFLRTLDAEGASELRRRPIPLRNSPQGVPKGAFADIDQFASAALDPYRTLVLRRSPTASRPPSQFTLAWSGRWYEVWQRHAGAARPLEHVPLGSAFEPAAPAPCRAVERLAAEAGPRGRLATVVRAPVSVTALATLSHAPRWSELSGDELQLNGRGSAGGKVHVARPGRYEVWLAGSFRSRLEVSVDARRVGALRHTLNDAGGYSPFGSVELAAGAHRLELRYSGPDLAPGSAGIAYPLGPLVLARAGATRHVVYVAARNAHSLCGKRLDWIEALRAS